MIFKMENVSLYRLYTSLFTLLGGSDGSLPGNL